VLRYLVTSKTRRRLLALLWGEDAHGSTAELAELAGVAFAGVHTELKAMQRTQLVVSERVGNKEVFSANADHPHATTMRALVASDAPDAPPPRKEDQRLRRKLVGLGAPLAGVAPLKASPARAAPTEAMETLVRGAALARRDATVARSLPLCFWKQRETLDIKALAALASGPEAKHAVGFFLELAGELGGDRRLAGMAELLRDRRRSSTHDFFLSPSGRGEAARPFPLAAKWGFRMNMDLESFRALFEKAGSR
jgi:hypothetical protein